MNAADELSDPSSPERERSPNKKVEHALRTVHEYTRDTLGIHPYHILFDSGLVLVAAMAVLFSESVSQIPWLRFLAAFAFTTVSFEVGYLRVKRALFGIDSRSYLQDLFAYVLPVWLVTAVGLGVDLRATMDLIGLQLPVLLGFIRVGCFLGGCCYGVPWKYGVRYPNTVFTDHDGNCQSFSSGENPGCRVFPIQLVEAAFNFLLFGVLLWRLLAVGVTGLTLPLYLLSYTGYRFLSDFLRMSSARPNWGPLSEAQWVSLAALTVIFVGLSLQANPVILPL